MYGPDFRATVQTGSGNGRIILSNWPILSILSVQISPSTAYPRQWTSLASGQWDIQAAPTSLYGTNTPSTAVNGGQAILIPPGYLNWCNGRNGWVVRTRYLNGWPHTSLTDQATPVSSGTQTIDVDDCTGWAVTNEWGQTGAAGIVYDSGFQETVVVTSATVTAGPGTLSLASALNYTHNAGTVVSAMPQSVPDAMILYCAAEALQRGATSTTIHAIPGGSGGGGSAGTIAEYIKQGNALLHPFRRTI